MYKITLTPKFSMSSPIQTYELPQSAQHKAFQIYEVEGKDISNTTYPHKTNWPHRHNYYEICFFINGSGKHEIDFVTHPIHSKSVHFISPGQVHLIARDKGYHGFLIVFTREFYSLDTFHQDLLQYLPFFNNRTMLPILNLNDQQFEDLLVLLKQMQKEYLSGMTMTKGVLRSFLQILLLKCRDFYLQHFAHKEKMNEPHFRHVQQFNLLVEQHFHKLHLVQDYSELLSLSPSQLNKYVKQITGHTAGEVIIDRLILEAKRLLLYTPLSNKEIAYELNYEDPSYFSRIFRKKTGQSPSGFRKLMDEKYQF